MVAYWEIGAHSAFDMFSKYKYLIVNMVFPRLGFCSGNFFLIAHFPDHHLLVPFYRSVFNARNKCLTAKLLQQGYRYHKLRKTFSKFYRRHYELISKYNVGLKTLLSEGLSEPEFYGDLVYKFKKLKGINDFSFQFRKIITRYRRIGYNLNVMRQSACLVFNPIMVDNYAAFFNCTPVGRASDSMMAPT